VFLRHPSGGRTMSAPDTPGAEARETVVFFWDSFGPMHVDRIAAVQAALHARARIIGVALRDRSDIYEWEFVEAGFERHTLFEEGRPPGFFARLRAAWSHFRSIGRGYYFLCHYERADVFLAAW